MLSRDLSLVLQSATAETLGQVRSRLDPAWLESLLAEGEVVSVRRRKMPAAVVVWLVLGACLFSNLSFTDVVRRLGLTIPTRRGGKQTPPSSGSIAAARERLPPAEMARLFRAVTARWSAEPEVARNTLRGLRIFAADGLCFNLYDSPSNAERFGRPASTGSARSAYPQMRTTCIVDVLTHLLWDAEADSYATAEIPLLERMLPRLPDNSVTVMDKGFASFGLFHRIQTGGANRHWMWLARSNLKARVIRSIGPGDDIVAVTVSRPVRAADPTVPPELEARRVAVRDHRGREYVLLTSLLDSEAFSPETLLDLYRQRWEAELSFDDIKTEQRGASETLRSKKPDGVLQEFFGLLLAYNLVRTEMSRAAALAGAPPIRMSFHRSLALICHHLHEFSATSAPSKAADRERDLREALAYLLLPERRSDRFYPRVKKQTSSRYPRKRIGEGEEVH